MQPRLSLSNIDKAYPSVVANSGVSLHVAAGSIHALLGENGAGKSTLMKIAYGVVQPDAGQIALDGQTVQIPNPQAARALGVAMVFQHFSLFDTLSVAQNVWLGLGKALSLAQVTEQIRAKASAYGLDIEPERLVHTLSVGEKQRVEIIRALLTQPKVLILDEPTSVLTPQAVHKLFGVLRQLQSEGCAIVYISHKLHEILALCDACTVMRGGKVVAHCDPKQETAQSLAALMIGPHAHQNLPKAAQSSEGDDEELCGFQAKKTLQAPPLLSLKQFHLATTDPFGVALKNIDLTVQAGEIVGIAGVSGNGQKELMHYLQDARFAADAEHESANHSSRDPFKPGAKVHAVPEERMGCGAVPSLSLADNLLLSRTDAAPKRFGLALKSPQRLAALAQRIIQNFGVKTGSGKAGGSAALAASLSGGNLQKFIVGREIDAQPQLLLVAQPTWGVDVAAAAQIHQALRGLKNQGAAVLLISDELDELLGLCDRLHVMAQGRLSPSLAAAQATPELIGQYMSGLWPENAALGA